jgi:hypothetical protein
MYLDFYNPLVIPCVVLVISAIHFYIHAYIVPTMSVLFHPFSFLVFFSYFTILILVEKIRHRTPLWYGDVL